MIERVYLISHSHIDLGYTDHPESLWPFYVEMLVRAMDLIEATRDYPPEAQYRYTCEVLCVLEYFLRNAPSGQVDRLLAHEKGGRLDIGAMWANFTPLTSRAEMEWTMQQVRRLRENYGLRLMSAMNSDVNGLPWAWVDPLVDAGVSGFTMAINEVRGRNPSPRSGFLWEGFSGRQLLTWCGEMYNWGRWFGVPQDVAQAKEQFSRYLDVLSSQAYAYPFVLLQVTGELHWGDNNWPSEHVADFVCEWNAARHGPIFEIVTLSQFLDRLRALPTPKMQVVRGDWPDWWSFGVGAMARETYLHRQTQAKLSSCRRVMSINRPRDASAIERRIDDAMRLCLLYDEHTFASDEAAQRPDSAFTIGTIIRKADYAYSAATIAEEVHQRLGHELRARLNVSEDQALVFNPWPRTLTQRVPIPASYATSNLRNPPPLAPNDFERAHGSGFESPVLTIAPGDHRVLSLPTLREPRLQDCADTDDLELNGVRLSLSKMTGAITKWSKDKIDFPLEDAGLNCLILETVREAGGRSVTWKPYNSWRIDGFGRHGSPDVLVRQRPERVLKVQRGGNGDEVLLRVCVELSRFGEAQIEYRPHKDGWGIDIVNQVDLPPWIEPWSLYCAFMPALTSPESWYDSAGVATRLSEQIAGACHDYASIGDWVAVSGSSHSFLLVSPDAPLVQMGGFNYLKRFERPAAASASHVMSWVANNHWDVNFPARQAGRLTIRYHIRWIAGRADESAFSQQTAQFSERLCWFPLTHWCAALRRSHAGSANRSENAVLGNAPTVQTRAVHAAAAKDINLDVIRRQRRTMADRSRRIIFNNDGGDAMCFPADLEVTADNLLAQRTLPLVGSHVDSIFYCTGHSFGYHARDTRSGWILDGYGDDPPYQMPQGKISAVRPLIECGADPLKVMVDFCHANGIEIFHSQRINDRHDRGTQPSRIHPEFSPFKQQHPEFLMGHIDHRPPHANWTAVDYSHSQVRDAMYGYLEEVCWNYDIDGIELDFWRAPILFKSVAWGGEADDAERDMMSSLIRRVRTMTETQGLRRGRPILVGIRVPDSLEYCRAIGIDLERWLSEDLVDLMVVGDAIRQWNPWETSVELGHRYGVKVYPCLQRAGGFNGEAPPFNRGSIESYRAKAMQIWQSSADGIYLFNFLKPAEWRPLLWEIGDRRALSLKAKTYYATFTWGNRDGDGGTDYWLARGSRHVTVPLLTPEHPIVVAAGTVACIEVSVGDDLSASIQEAGQPHIVCYLQAAEENNLTVRLNGVRLERRQRSGPWLELPIDAEILRQGPNTFQFELEGGAPRPWKLNDLVISVRLQRPTLLAEERKRMVNRRRRIIFNNDGDDLLRLGGERTPEPLSAGGREKTVADYPITPEGLLRVRTAALLGSHVDSIWYYSSWGLKLHQGDCAFARLYGPADPNAPSVSTFLSNARNLISSCGRDALEIMVDACHRTGLEVFYSNRMNDIHDSYAGQLGKTRRLRRERPGWLLSSSSAASMYVYPDARSMWSAWNFEVPQVRQLTIDALRDVCQTYDIDGIELDFLRGPIYFQESMRFEPASGENVARMSDMVRQIRQMTEEEGFRRGRPILLAVRVAESETLSLSIGLDVRNWMKEGLVDVLVLGTWLAFTLPVRSLIETAHKYHVPAYPINYAWWKGIDYQPGTDIGMFSDPTVWRGDSLSLFGQGADGIYMFNCFDPDLTFWSELGDPATLLKLDRTYVWDYLKSWRERSDVYVQLRLLTLGPRALFTEVTKDGCETMVLNVGEDLSRTADQGDSISLALRVHVRGLTASAGLVMFINGKTLGEPASMSSKLCDNPLDLWLDFSPDPDDVRKGENHVTARLLGADQPPHPKIDRVRLEVRVQRNKSH